MEATTNRMRAAFAEVARGLMEWEDPPTRETDPCTCGTFAALDPLMHASHCPRSIYRPRGKQETPEYVEPFDVQADWDERGS